MITSISKQNNFLTEITNGSNTILSDVTKDYGGSGEQFRPHELLCSALAACMNITTRKVLEQLNLKYKEVRIKIELNKTKDKTEFLYHIDIDGDLSDKMKERVISLAKDCAVHKTLSNEISFQMMP